MFDKTREKLLELHEKHGRGMFNILKARANREIFDRIYELTNEACRGRDISFSTRCYLIFHGMKDFPECQNENCHNRVIENINSFQTGFHRFCSVKCGSEAESTKKKIGKTKTEKYGCSYFNNYEKTKRTNMERYGVQHTFQTENNREKAKSTKLEKYGNENYVNIEKMKKTNLERYGSCCPLVDHMVHEKRLNSMIENYGVEYTLQSDELRNKVKSTCLETYGDENYRNQEKAKQTRLDRYGDEWFNNRERYRQTCLERYGSESYCSTDECKQKVYQTCMARYGVPSYMNSHEFKERSEQTCIEKFGVPYYSQTDKFREQTSIRHSDEFYERLCTCKDVIPMFSNEELVCRDPRKELKWRCNRCGEEFYSRLDHRHAHDTHFASYARCPNCDRHYRSKSNGELELLEHIGKIYHGELVSGDRNTIKPLEIDIMMKDISTGIEYDGLIWHSEHFGIGPVEMLKKTQLCEDVGIRLIRVYSDEWLNNRDFTMWKLQTLISSREHCIENTSIVRNGDHRDIFYGDERIGMYRVYDDLVVDVILGTSDLNRSFLQYIAGFERSAGGNISSFIFDRRFYSKPMIDKISSNVKMIEQTRYIIGRNWRKEITAGDECDNVLSYIWDCGYLQLII